MAAAASLAAAAAVTATASTAAHAQTVFEDEASWHVAVGAGGAGLTAIDFEEASLNPAGLYSFRAYRDPFRVQGASFHSTRTAVVGGAAGGVDRYQYVVGGSFFGGAFSVNGSAGNYVGACFEGSAAGAEFFRAAVDITFDSAQNVFGTQYGFGLMGGAYPTTHLFDVQWFQGDELRGQTTVTLRHDLENPSFLGFTSAAGFDRVRFTSRNNEATSGYLALDDVRYGGAGALRSAAALTPEGDGSALFAAAALPLAAGMLLRRRRRQEGVTANSAVA